MVSIELIKKLREETGVSLQECKKALEASSGDIGKAKEILRKRGIEIAGKKTERQANAGLIASYVHPNKKLGVIIDIRCETDFVVRSEDFQNLAHELCLQIAALEPRFVAEADIPTEILENEKGNYAAQFKDSGKPKKIIDEIIEGKLNKFKTEFCLLFQPWIKDDSKTVKDLINDYIVKLGENIIIKQFYRLEI